MNQEAQTVKARAFEMLSDSQAQLANLQMQFNQTFSTIVTALELEGAVNEAQIVEAIKALKVKAA